MRQVRSAGRDVLVLWRWPEANQVEGRRMDSSVGGQMRAIRAGDRLFVCATHLDDLFLLGIMRVSRIRRVRGHPYGSHRAQGRNLSGPFKIIALRRDLLTRLRFASTGSDRLALSRPLAHQVRAHRFLAPESARLLQQLLRRSRRDEGRQTRRLRNVFRSEGRLMAKSLSVRERDPRVRRGALLRYGRRCMVCEFDFSRKYGNNRYAECVEVHHLHVLATQDRARPTKLTDVIVVCPNCHRALHRSNDPADWKSLRRTLT
jgi:5-methylcytosine-specific restriction endonuclease McrA